MAPAATGMIAKFRKDYDGEFVLTQVKISNNQTYQQREWIPNVISNTHVSPRAACVGGYDLLGRFDFRKLKGHKGGLLAKKALQTYGTGTLWRDMEFHFFVTSDTQQADIMVNSGYTPRNIVYTTSKICLDHPDHFYPVPHLPAMDQLALNVYLAAFDEHSEIFLINYNVETPGGTANWINDVNTIFRTYDMIKFVLVGVAAAMPTVWRNNPNVSVMDSREFVSYCDV